MISLGFSSCSSAATPQPAPAWTLKDLDGKAVSLADFKGKIVVLNFWATWCPPCVREIPDFIAVQKEYQDKGVVFVGISVDSIQPAVVAAFVKKMGVNYPILLTTDDVSAKYGADEGVPITCVIKRDGTIAVKQVGLYEKADLESELKQLL